MRIPIGIDGSLTPYKSSIKKIISGGNNIVVEMKSVISEICAKSKFFKEKNQAYAY